MNVIKTDRKTMLLHLLTNSLLYLTNGTRKGHSYYGRQIGTCMHSIKWCYFRWPWVTLNYPISTFCIAFHIIEIETSNIVGRLITANPSPWMTNRQLPVFS